MAIHLKARSISRMVRERLPKTPSKARVISVFGRVCNLVSGDCQVTALVLPEVGNGPLNIVAEARLGDLSSIERGMTARLEKRQLWVGGLEVDLGEASVWEPCPDWEELRARKDAIGKRLPMLQAFALQHATEGSFLTVVSGRQADGEPHLAGIKSVGSTSAIVLATAREAIEFVRAGWQRDAVLLQAGASQLAGLGGGLTPAGDDFLTGVMMWAWLTHPNPGFLCHLLLEAAAPRTTTLSAALLGAASRGECNAAWHLLLEALSERTDAQVDGAVQEVLSHGATSGADALAGFLWAGLFCASE